MNALQHDNIQTFRLTKGGYVETTTAPQEKEKRLNSHKRGINKDMKPQRRKAKQARYQKNQAERV